MKTFTSFKALLMLMLMGLILYSPISQAQNRNITGSVVCNDVYIPGTSASFEFTVTWSSPDYEYFEDLDITIPAGFTITAATAINGNPAIITGNDIHWDSEVSASSGSIDFFIDLDVDPGNTGDIMFDWHIWGDLYGGLPHDIVGQSALRQAVPSIEGFVLNGGGQTIAGATVEIVENGRTATTDPTGYYLFYTIDDGTYNLVASKTGYNTSDPATVTLSGGGLVSQDFTLTAPNINVSPLIFNETLRPNEYMTAFLSMLNTGDGPLDFTAAVIYPEEPGVALPNVENQVVESNSISSAGAIPADMQTIGENRAPVFLNSSRDGDNIAWVSSPQGGVASILYTMDMATYGTTNIGASAIDPASGDFMNGDATTLYVASGWGAGLSAVNVATGASTLIANFTGLPAGYSVSGMACDRTSNTMYVSMTNSTLTASQIGTVNVATGVVTPIGSSNTVAPGLIDIAIDGTGQMYGWCLVTDASYLIDKTTGSVGFLGSLGFDANYGQGGNWDADNDVIYLTAFNNTAFQGQLRALDRATGGTTFLAVLPQLQMTAYGVPNSGAAGASGWLSLSDYSGTVAPGGGSFNVGVNFDASGTAAGEVYTADIIIGSDPFVGEITIPVTMSVAGDPLPEVTGFTANLTNAIDGQVSLSWDALRSVTFEYFLVKRNGVVVASTTDNFFVDMLPTFGTYDYTVQAIYLEGDGVIAGPETVEWYQPELCYSPASPENTQWIETMQPVMLELENCNNGVLAFSFPDYAARALLSDPNVEKNVPTPDFRTTQSGDEMKGKDDEFNGDGNPIVLGAGGPDAFGYVWIDSDEAGGPVYNWMDISATGTLVTGLGDDNIVGPFPMGFDFPFYGQAKPQFWINSNGTIGFTSSYITLSNVAIPTTNTNKDFIAWFWDDMDPANANTSVYYQNFDKYTVVQFNNYYEYPDGNRYIDAQVIIYKNGSIMINYDYIDPGFDLDGSTIGIQSSGADGLQVAYNTDYVHDDLALSFTLPSHFIVDLEPMSGTIGAGEKLDVTMTYSSEGFEVGAYTEDVFISTNEQPVNEWNIHNTMYVVLPANITGMVTDCNSGAALSNVTITATTVTKDLEDTFTTETDENGNYMLYVNADTDYDVSASLTGYAPQMATVSVAMAAVADFELCEEPYPVSWVDIDPNEADTQCLVSWSLPMGPYMISYDDGSAEDYFAWVGPGGSSAVKFTPAGYPATVQGGSIYVGDGSFPVGGNFIGTQMAFGVVDDDGPGGMPGTVVDSVVVTVNNYGWVDLSDLFDATFNDGDFYLVMWQLGFSPNVAPVGVDIQVPTVFRSYVKANGGSWMVSAFNDFMIRAIVSGPGENVMSLAPEQMIYPGKLSPDTYVSLGQPNGVPGLQGKADYKPVIVENADRDLVSYQLYRISGIDPENGIYQEDGVMTLVRAALTTQEFNDVNWGALAPGFYAYAVTATYENGDVSDITYSDIAAHLLDNVVTLNISQCDGLSPEGASVALTGLNWPNQMLMATTDATGVVVFDSVIDGFYNLRVTKEGYQTYERLNVNISNDFTENIVMQEISYPARDLTVDPMTSVANWKSPLVVYMKNQGFDEGTPFPPTGWMTETNSSVGWFHTGNGSSSFWTIPAGDGWYACTNDDAANDDGSNDYLIMPVVDLSMTDGYILQFDAYFSGTYGQSGTVEYSLDGGSSWTVAFTLPAATTWTTYQVNLDMVAGNETVWVAFHSDDNGFWASGMAVDNVMTYYGKAPVGYYVYLDGGFVGETAKDVTTFTFNNLTYGVTYEAAVRALYSCGTSEPVTYTFTSDFLYPPRDLSNEYIYGTNEVPLMWYPPMTVAGPASKGAVQNELVTGSTPVLTASTTPFAGEVNDNPSLSQLRESSIAWADNVFDDIWYTVDVDNLATNDIGAAGMTAFCGDFAKGNNEIMYAINYDTDRLIAIDVATGTYTDIASAPSPLAGGIFSGMATDKNTGIVYVVATDLSQTAFGTIDLTTGVFTQIGSNTTVSPGCIEIAIDGSGQAYGWDIVTDMSYTIDKETGVFTELGALGYDANFAQGGNYDPVNDEIYMAAYGSVNELRILDRATGGTITVGALPNETGAFGFPGGGSGGGGTVPDGLLSFNVYESDRLIANVPYNGEGTGTPIRYVDNDVMPGCYSYEVTAVYDLTDFGFPGEVGESSLEGPDEVCVVWGFDLPFCETWDQGSFDFNQWTASSENWAISSQDGDPAPSAQFNWDPLLTDGYSSTLTSAPFNADMLTEGDFWLDFDLALDNRNATGDEVLSVEVYDGVSWKVVAEFANDASFGYESNHINITNFVRSSVFQVRFNATGENSFDVIAWNVDNICIYRECAAPFNLTGEYVWNSQDELGAQICWEAAVSSGGEWLSYGDGPYVAGIGLDPIGPVTVAIEWDQADLAAYDGMLFSKINLRYGNAENFGNVLLQIWENEVLILEETISAGDVIVNDWNEFSYDSPVVIDASKSYRIGYTVTDWNWNPDGPCGAQAFTGSLKSDLVLLDGVWDNLSNYLANSWLIETYISESGAKAPVDYVQLESAVKSTASAANLVAVTADPVYRNDEKGASRALTTFNVYRSMEGADDYTLIATVPAEVGVGEYCYYDTDVTFPETYCYQVTAMYMSDTDECESMPAAAFDNPMDDFVCVLITSTGSDLERSTRVYPNPANDFVSIECQDMKDITVFNYVGQVVFRSDLGQANSTQLNTSKYESGVYVVRINTENGVVVKRVIINR